MKTKDLNKQIICQALGWDEGDYHVYKFETAYKYLEKTVVMPDRISIIARTRTWWIWWTDQWEIIDQAYVNGICLTAENVKALSASTRYELTEVYLAEHDAKQMKVYLPPVLTRLIDRENAGKLKIK